MNCRFAWEKVLLVFDLVFLSFFAFFDSSRWMRDEGWNRAMGALYLVAYLAAFPILLFLFLFESLVFYVFGLALQDAVLPVYLAILMALTIYTQYKYKKNERVDQLIMEWLKPQHYRTFFWIGGILFVLPFVALLSMFFFWTVPGRQ
ncbi:MAG: hypothetical protein JJU00_19250 [Opitutales bacterium]|nr:hypothetical protein [Opitutales bacterium]